MSIEWFRDLVICIFGLGATLVVIFLGVLAFMLYRRLRPILDNVRNTTQTVQDFTSRVEEEVAGPLSKVVSFIQGVRAAVGMVGRFTKNKEEE
jgi:hypothetical protein